MEHNFCIELTERICKRVINISFKIDLSVLNLIMHKI
jgi:hypothetical protein